MSAMPRPVASRTAGPHRSMSPPRCIMPDPELPLYANRPLTPRQDRIEAAIERVLRTGGTRSELREAVHQFADHARMQQIALERALILVKGVALRAASSAAMGSSAV